MALSSLFNGLDTQASPNHGASENLSTSERLTRIEKQLLLQNEMLSKILTNDTASLVKPATSKPDYKVQQIDMERYQTLYKAMAGNIVGTIATFRAILEAETGEKVTNKAIAMSIFRMKKSAANGWQVEALTKIGRETFYKLSIKEKRT